MTIPMYVVLKPDYGRMHPMYSPWETQKEESHTEVQKEGKGMKKGKLSEHPYFYGLK